DIGLSHLAHELDANARLLTQVLTDSLYGCIEHLAHRHGVAARFARISNAKHLSHELRYALCSQAFAFSNVALGRQSQRIEDRHADEQHCGDGRGDEREAIAAPELSCSVCKAVRSRPDGT